MVVCCPGQCLNNITRQTKASDSSSCNNVTIMCVILTLSSSVDAARSSVGVFLRPHVLRALAHIFVLIVFVRTGVLKMMIGSRCSCVSHCMVFEQMVTCT